MEYRIEHDSLGEVRVPADHMWGAQTQRSFENFKIGHTMPKEIIRAFAILKKCAAKVNEERGALPKEKAEAIRSACEEGHAQSDAVAIRARFVRRRPLLG